MLNQSYFTNGDRPFNFLSPMKYIFEIIQQNFDKDDFTIKDICEQAGISRMNLHRKIKKRTGKGTSAYIRHLRLEKAKEILETEEDINVAEVAFQVGFKDPNYFTRLFKEAYGKTPSAFKQ